MGKRGKGTIEGGSVHFSPTAPKKQSEPLKASFKVTNGVPAAINACIGNALLHTTLRNNTKKVVPNYYLITCGKVVLTPL